jgi:uncharacterized phage-associated protein
MTLSKELESISKSIIYIHRELFGESPSPMKLQKLCYYAQGYALADDKELFCEEFQAWQHGPVVYELYSQYKHFQWRQITDDVDEINAEVGKFLQDIVAAYGRYDGAALSTMTHRESPWVDARGDLDESEGSTALITKESLKKFFQAKLKLHG